MAARSEGLPRRESTCRRDRRPNVPMGGGEALGQNREGALCFGQELCIPLSIRVHEGVEELHGPPEVRDLEGVDCLGGFIIGRYLRIGGLHAAHVAFCHVDTWWWTGEVATLFENNFRSMLRACIAQESAVQHNARARAQPRSTRPTITWTEVSPTGLRKHKSVPIGGLILVGS